VTLIRSDAYRQLQTLNQLFNRQQEPARFEDVQVGSSWTPAVDVREKDGEVILTAEIPGVPLADISISLENNVLSISGQRAAQTDVEEASYHWRERATGSFRRTFTLATTADRDKIVATYKDGVLTMVVPQKPEAKPKQIAVKAAA
jgi:HSP20 family protein